MTITVAWNLVSCHLILQYVVSAGRQWSGCCCDSYPWWLRVAAALLKNSGQRHWCDCKCEMFMEVWFSCK